MVSDKFSPPTELQEGVIIRRPNRFIVEAEVNGHVIKAHCPVSGRIGGFTMDGLPALFSGPYEGRGTTHTMEAFALETVKGSATFQWIGVNQTRANRLVEHSFTHSELFTRAFPEALKGIKREATLGSSRLDFHLEGGAWVEVKTPLLIVAAANPEDVPIKEFKTGNPSGRLPRQLQDLTSVVKEGERAILLTCFLYENTSNLTLEEQHRANVFLDDDLQAARTNGLEEYVATFVQTPEGITPLELREV